MELKDIIKSAYKVAGTFREVKLSEKGKKTVEAIYDFTGRFTYNESDFEMMMQIISNTYDTESYQIISSGYIAGYRNEFIGDLMIIKKK